MRYTTSAKMFAAGTALFLFTSPALALDANDLVRKLNAALNLQTGNGLSAGSVTVDGSDVTLANSRLELGEGAGSLPLGTIELEGVEESAGSYTVETMSFADIEYTQDNAAVTASDLSISGIRIPADPNGNTVDALLLFKEANGGRLEVKGNDESTLTIASSRITTELADDESSMKFEMHVEDIKGDLRTTKDAGSRRIAEDLGLDDIHGKVSMVAAWDLEPGTFAVQEFAIDFADIGRLDTTFSITGYTLDFLQSTNKLVKVLEDSDNPQEAEQSADSIAFELLQQVNFNSAQIRFEDAGITRKALDVIAKKDGKTGDDMAQMIKVIAPMMLARFNIPNLQKSSEALNTYLDDPSSLTISAKPQSPVHFSTIMDAAMNAPNTIPHVLGVAVTAND